MSKKKMKQLAVIAAVLAVVIVGPIAFRAASFFVGDCWKGLAEGPAGALYREIVCGLFLGKEHEFCRNHCGPKGEGAFWCDPQNYDNNVLHRGMISFVAEGGCRVAAAKCAGTDDCPAKAWTCLAECYPDPHRFVSEAGCGCEGNWTPQGKECVCKYPNYLKGGECLVSPDADCYYDAGNTPTFFACIAPTQEVQIYWQGKSIHKCQGACYTSLCVANESIRVGGRFWYVRGSLQEAMAAQGDTRSRVLGPMGGYYQVCVRKM